MERIAQAGNHTTENSRGLGRVFQRTYKDRKTGQRKKLQTWWIEFHDKGRQIRKATGSTKRKVAMKILREHLDASTSGKLIAGRGERFRFDDLAGLLRRDYSLNQRRSLRRGEAAIAHLRSHFRNHRAKDITDHDKAGFSGWNQASCRVLRRHRQDSGREKGGGDQGGSEVKSCGFFECRHDLQ